MECLVLCVNKDQWHCDDACLVQCHRCGREVWMSPHNMDKKAVCIACVEEMTKASRDKFIFALSDQDLRKALNEILKKGEKNPPKSV